MCHTSGDMTHQSAGNFQQALGHTPFLHDLASHDKKWDAVVPELSKGLEPLCALYNKSCLPVIEENLKKDQRKLSVLFDQVHTLKVSEDALREVDAKLVSFENINRTTDLEAINHLLHG